MCELLRDLYRVVKRHVCGGEMHVNFGPALSRNVPIPEGVVMAVALPVDKKITASISPTDFAGNPAKVDGVPVWSVSDPNLADIAAAENGMSCVVTPKGPVGTLQLKVEADADLGEGVKSLVGLADIDLIAGEAVSLTPVFGAPEPK